MESRSIAALFLLLLVFASPLAAEEQFDFYYLVLQWPGAFCAQTFTPCCRPTTGEPQNDFFVRGLLPVNNSTGEVVTACNSDPFDVDQLSDLSDDLHGYWSNIRCPRNDGASYWNETWKTYGGCSGLSEADYFRTALQLRSKVDVFTALKKKEITPRIEDVYFLSDIKNAIAEAAGAAPEIRCSRGPVGDPHFYEVYICVAKDGETIIECPVKPRFICPISAYFFPFETDRLLNNPTANLIEMPVSI